MIMKSWVLIASWITVQVVTTYTICSPPGCASIQFFWDITSSLGANLAYVNTMVNEVHHCATSEKLFCHPAVISEREKESTRHRDPAENWTSEILVGHSYRFCTVKCPILLPIFCPPNLSFKAFNNSEMERSNTPNSGYSACPHDV